MWAVVSGCCQLLGYDCLPVLKTEPNWLTLSTSKVHRTRGLRQAPPRAA